MAFNTTCLDLLHAPEKFFQTYFANDREALRFLEDSQKLKIEGDETVSELINTLHRFAVLALSVQGQTYSDGMYLFFMRICLETMAKVMKKGKKEVINLFYDKCLNFQRIEERIKVTKIGETEEVIYTLTREDLGYFVKMIRDNIAHEGECWLYSFTAEYVPKEISIQIKKIDNSVYQKLTEYNGGNEVCSICFVSSLYRDDLTIISVQGFIKLILLYMNEGESKTYSYSLRDFYSNRS